MIKIDRKELTNSKVSGGSGKGNMTVIQAYNYNSIISIGPNPPPIPAWPTPVR